MDNESFPWPCPSDVLFTSNVESWHIACVGWSRAQWFGYAEGYRRAVEVLLAHVLASGTDSDTLIYPIIFSFRHYVELKLKYIINRASGLLDRPQAFPLTHDISSLWHEALPLLAEILKGEWRNELHTVAALIRELDANDRSSMVYRYPEDKSGAPHHAKSCRIDVGRFRTTAQNLSAFFEACSDVIECCRDDKAEMQREFLDREDCS